MSSNNTGLADHGSNEVRAEETAVGVSGGVLVPNRVFVGGLGMEATETDLHDLFSGFGNVTATKIIMDKSGGSKGYGFVTFETEEEARKVQDQTDSFTLKERRLNVAAAYKKQHPYPRQYDSTQSSHNNGGNSSGTNINNNAIYYQNGVAYTFQNGVAMFHDPSGAPFMYPAAAQYYYAAAAAQQQQQQMMLQQQYGAYAFQQQQLKLQHDSCSGIEPESPSDLGSSFGCSTPIGTPIGHQEHATSSTMFSDSADVSASPQQWYPDERAFNNFTTENKTEAFKSNEVYCGFNAAGGAPNASPMMFPVPPPSTPSGTTSLRMPLVSMPGMHSVMTPPLSEHSFQGDSMWYSLGDPMMFMPPAPGAAYNASHGPKDAFDTNALKKELGNIENGSTSPSPFMFRVPPSSSTASKSDASRKSGRTFFGQGATSSSQMPFLFRLPSASTSSKSDAGRRSGRGYFANKSRSASTSSNASGRMWCNRQQQNRTSSLAGSASTPPGSTKVYTRKVDRKRGVMADPHGHANSRRSPPNRSGRSATSTAQEASPSRSGSDRDEHEEDQLEEPPAGHLDDSVVNKSNAEDVFQSGDENDAAEEEEEQGDFVEFSA